MEFDLSEKQVNLKVEMSEYLSKLSAEDVSTSFYKNISKEKIGEVLTSQDIDYVSKVTTFIELAKVYPSISIGLVDTVVSVAALQQNTSTPVNQSLAFTEERAGSDLSMIETKAESSSDGWVLSGEKKHIFCTEFTEELVVLAQLEDSSYGLFRVPVTDKNVSVIKLEAMGLEEVYSTTIILKEVVVSPTQLVLKVGSDFNQLKETLMLNTLYASAIAVGTAEKALAQALEHARTRKQFGSVIGEFQAIQFKVAEMTVGINASKTLLYEAAQKLDRKEEADTEIYMSKVYASETAKVAVDHSLQIHGSSALVSSSPISKLYQFQRLLELHAQTSELLRLKIADKLIESYSDELIETY